MRVPRALDWPSTINTTVEAGAALRQRTTSGIEASGGAVRIDLIVAALAPTMFRTGYRQGQCPQFPWLFSEKKEPMIKHANIIGHKCSHGHLFTFICSEKLTSIDKAGN